MIIELYDKLISTIPNIQFQDLNSFIRCLAHILNLIVYNILKKLKTGSIRDAHALFENYLTVSEANITNKTALV